jgi:hypothetical protein
VWHPRNIVRAFSILIDTIRHMSIDLPLACACGTVRGVAGDVSRATGNRMVCYCHDCQAFAHFLGRADVLDAHGGTDVYQMAPGRLRITDGAAQLACVRLGPKGLFRWYAACCRTPIGNSVTSLPFVGLIDAFVDHRGAGHGRDEVMGKPIAYAYVDAAVGGAPAHARGKSELAVVLRVLGLIAGWVVRGKARPSPFFDGKKRPIVEPKVLTAEERAKLPRKAP